MDTSSKSSVSKDPEAADILALAQACLTDSTLAEQLCDHIYDRLQLQLRIEQERAGYSTIGR